MKRIVAIVMTVLMLLAVLAPVASAATASPVKSYDEAEPGELLYTVNFNGDSAFQPARLDLDAGQMDYTVVENGAGIRITPKSGTQNQTQNFWGGLIKDLEANENTIYSMVYKAKADGAIGKNNAVGVGGWAVGEAQFQQTNGVYNVYANHNTVDATGSTLDQRAALSEGIMKIEGYVMVKEKPAIAVDSDGFITALVVYDGTTCKFSNYYLAAGATDLKDEASWIKFEEQWMNNAILPGDPTNYMCFWTYTFYNTIDTTIKNVQYYKDYIWGCGHEFTVTDILAPTCYDEGRTTYTCTKCYRSYTEIVGAIGHDFSGATCMQMEKCTVCGAESGYFAYHYDYDINGKCDACDTVVYEEVISAAQAKNEDLEAKLDELEKKLAALEGGAVLDGSAALEGITAPGALVGCSGTVGAAGLAFVAALGSCAIFVEKKRK